ncbi:MAG: PQQ-binding-like beta-propeller repeat protein [Myxococcota bacterium]
MNRAIVICGILASCQSQASPLWRYSDAPGRVSAPDRDGDLVAFGGSDGLLLLTASGEKRCALREYGPVAARPVVEGQQVWFAAMGGQVLAIDSNCSVRWTSQPPLGRFTSDLLKFGDVLYAASTDGHVYAFRADTGKKRWQFPRAGVTPRRLRGGAAGPRR